MNTLKKAIAVCLDALTVLMLTGITIILVGTGIAGIFFDAGGPDGNDVCVLDEQTIQVTSEIFDSAHDMVHTQTINYRIGESGSIFERFETLENRNGR